MTRHVEPLERVAHDERRLPHLIERRLLAGIEVEVHVVGPVDVVAACVPLVQIDAPEVHHPQEGREILDHREVDDVFRRVVDATDLDPIGARGGRALHEEEGPAGAVGIALHHHGAVADVGEQHRRHVGIVLEEVALGEAELRPEGLPEVGERDSAGADRDGDAVAVAGDLDRASPLLRHQRASGARRGGRGPWRTAPSTGT